LEAVAANQFDEANLIYASNLVCHVCEISGQHNIIKDIRRSFRGSGLLDAIQRHDDDVIFNWLVEAISYQGISDAAADSYIAEHGMIAAADIREAVSGNCCVKTSSYWRFENCGYRKTKRNCNEPQIFGRCPLPKHDLRNGNLSQAAYSLFLFFRDVCSGDFVGWLDEQLSSVGNSFGVAGHGGDAVITPLLQVFGVSHKVLNMTLANLLLGGDPKRKRWIAAGAGMIAVDSLVHAWLWRSGILKRLKAVHPYGPQCYGPRGCAAIIEAMSARIDARTFNRTFPKEFPRFVQKAIWYFCAGAGLDHCNGNRIDDRHRCAQTECILFDGCGRVKLGT
jgi:hypothetical protein